MTVDGSSLVGLRGLACLHVMVRDILKYFFLALARLTDGCPRKNFALHSAQKNEISLVFL